MDAQEILIAGLGVFCAVLLVVIALRWRRMLDESPRLPLWGFLRRNTLTRDDVADMTSAQAVMDAELACSVCGSSKECRARLAPGSAALIPPENCPNARLFKEFGVAVNVPRE